MIVFETILLQFSCKAARKYTKDSFLMIPWGYERFVVVFLISCFWCFIIVHFRFFLFSSFKLLCSRVHAFHQVHVDVANALHHLIALLKQGRKCFSSCCLLSTVVYTDLLVCRFSQNVVSHRLSVWCIVFWIGYLGFESPHIKKPKKVAKKPKNHQPKWGCVVLRVNGV